MALSVTVDEKLLLLSPVILLTVMFPLVASPSTRFPPAIFWSSAPVMVMSPAVSPKPIVPPSETRMVTVPVPAVSETPDGEVISMSLAVILMA